MRATQQLTTKEECAILWYTVLRNMSAVQAIYEGRYSISACLGTEGGCPVRFCSRALFRIFDSAICENVWDAATEHARLEWCNIISHGSLVISWLKAITNVQMLLRSDTSFFIQPRARVLPVGFFSLRYQVDVLS